jgi:glycosyltransferase involved in cell wall biosynthesis
VRIAYITADFGVPVLGTKGASAHVRGLVRELHGLGHEVLLLAANSGGEPDRAAGFSLNEVPFAGAALELYEALNVEQLCQENRLAKDLRNVLYALSLELQGRLLLEEFRPDLIYERYCLLSTAGLELARYFGVPFLLEVNAPLVLEQQKQRGLSLPIVARAAERLALTGADHVIAVSTWLREYVTAEGVSADRVSVIPNAADPNLFHPRPGRSEIRRRLGWQDRFVIGFTGSMKSWHGVSTLLEALHHLGASESPFRVLLVGAGPELPGLRRQITEHHLDDCVHLTDAVPHARMPDMLDAMDVAVATYAADADAYFSPVKLFEYMAMARPVVAARVGQVSEIIEHGHTGWLYTPGDACELAGVIRTLQNDPDMCRTVGAAARRRVLSTYTWRHNALRVLGIAEELIATSKAVARDGSARVASRRAQQDPAVGRAARGWAQAGRNLGST